MTDNLPQIKVFVIGPIGDKDEPHGSDRRIVYEEGIQVLEQVIEPACTVLDLEVLRADQITRTGEIPEQIFRQIRDAHIVIADLTGANPNVMYELGLRHTTGKLTIQIGERGRLPFDVSSIRTIMFKRSEGGLVEARRSVIQALANGLQSGGDHVTATRVWFEANLTEIEQEEDSTDDEIDEPGFLEKLADSEEGMAAISQTLQTATSIVLEISGIFSREASSVQDKSATEKLLHANRIAALLEDPSSRLRITVTEYSRIIDRIEPGIIYLLGRLTIEQAEAIETTEFLKNIKTFIDAASSSMDSTIGFKQSVEELSKSTRSMKKVNRVISSSLQLFVDSSQKIVSWRNLLKQIPLSCNL